jgi:hypothetical protein
MSQDLRKCPRHRLIVNATENDWREPLGPVARWNLCWVDYSGNCKVPLDERCTPF